MCVKSFDYPNIYEFSQELSPMSKEPRIRTTQPRVRRDFPWRPATPCSETEEDPSEPEEWEEELEIDPLVTKEEEWEEELEIDPLVTTAEALDLRNKVIDVIGRLCRNAETHYPEHNGESSTVEFPNPKKRGRGPDKKPRKRRSSTPKVKPPKTAGKKRGRGPDKRPRKRRGSKNHPPSPAISDTIDDPCHDIVIISDDDEVPPAPPQLAAAH